MNKLILCGAAAILAVSGLVIACSDDSGSTNNANNNPFTPTGTLEAGANPPGTGNDGGTLTDGGCPNKPEGCFCGEPKTQADWLNRCTTSAAIKVNLTVKPATATDVQ